MAVTREAFQRTIDANPGASGPGLVFADWLEEHGETDEAETMRVAYSIEEQPGKLPAAVVRRLFSTGAAVTEFSFHLIGRFKGQRQRGVFHTRCYHKNAVDRRRPKSLLDEVGSREDCERCLAN